VHTVFGGWPIHRGFTVACLDARAEEPQDQPALPADTQEASPIRGDRDVGLPAGYRADPLSEPGLVVVRGPDGAVVARFTLFADREEVRRAAEQDESGSDVRRDD
jgi:hypothetical protein